MALHTWNFDAPLGVYKNHALSSKMRHAAIAETKVMQFVETEPGYGKKRGESLTIFRVSNMAVPTDGRISESERIPEDNVQLSTTQITVSEWGRAVPYTSFITDLSEFDPSNYIQRALMDQMKLTLDRESADSFKSTLIKAVGTGVGSISITTNGTPGGTASANLNMFHVEAIRDFMHSDLNVPAFSSDDYMCLISTKAKRGIMNDPAWEPWVRYTSPESKYNSEIGRIENVRFVEVNNLRTLSGSIGTGGITGEALFFGADSVVMVVAEDPELRTKVPEDYGRDKGVAWYGILEFGLVWDTSNPGEARVIHWTSL